jgi:hypothetical protein
MQEPRIPPRLSRRIWESSATWTSIAAIIIAIVGLVITLVSAHRAEKQYLQLNTPRVHITGVRFHPVKILTRDSAYATPWGYHAFILPQFDTLGIQTDKYELLSRLSIHGDPITREAPLLTWADLLHEAELRGDTLGISAEVRFGIKIRNDGVLPVYLRSLHLLCTHGCERETNRQLRANFGIFSQQEKEISFNFIVDPGKPFPDSVKFDVDAVYSIGNKHMSAHTPIMFNRSRGLWRIDGFNLVEIS